MKSIFLSIIIPTYNEKDGVISLIEKICDELARKKYVFEILVIDDDSPDQTGYIVRRRFRRDPHIRTYIRNTDRSLGKSILFGVENARGNIIIGMDGDGNHDPSVIPHIIRKLAHSDLVVASRFVKGGGMEDRFRFLASWCFNAWLRLLYGFPIWDNTSGFYGISRDTLMTLIPSHIYYGYGEYHLRLVYYAHISGLRIKEVPVFYPNRQSGQSKSRLPTMVATYLHTARTLRTRHI